MVACMASMTRPILFSSAPPLTVRLRPNMNVMNKSVRWLITLLLGAKWAKAPATQCGY